MFLYMSINIWPRPTENLNECASWMCFTTLYLTKLQYTHLSIAVVCLFLICDDPVQLYTCIFWMFCGQHPVRFWWVVQFSQVSMLLSQVKSKVRPSRCVFRSLGGVYNMAKPHCEATKQLYNHSLSPQDIFSQPFCTSPTHAYTNHVCVLISL